MRSIFTPVMFAILMLFAAGCSTSQSAARFGEASGDYTTLSQDSVAVTLGHIDERTLFRLYGQKNNPFVRYKSGTLIVIEVTVQSDESLLIDLDDVQLVTPGGTRGNASKREVYDYYYAKLINNYGGYSRHHSPHSIETFSQPVPNGEPYITYYSYGGRNTNALDGWSLKYTTQVVDETILPQDLLVQQRTETTGYILFEQVRGERKVDATFTLPVYTPNNELIHEFTYTFKI
jgi:hypothetical protein